MIQRKTISMLLTPVIINSLVFAVLQGSEAPWGTIFLVIFLTIVSLPVGAALVGE